LGERNNGFKIALNALNVGRIKLAAACLDAQRRILNYFLNYSNERKQFVFLSIHLEPFVRNWQKWQQALS
jgi:alkylation response protein AidB-like acyl-CoA dehydrogenase